MFIIIGIILLACVSFVFFYLSLETDQDSSKEDTGKDQHIIGFIEGCVDQKSKQALFYLGFIGGDTWVESTDGEVTDPFRGLYYEYDEYYKIPYHFYNNIPIIESIKIEKILSTFMDDNLKYCIKSFQNFDDAEFEFGEAKTEIFLKDEEVVFNVDYPVTVKRFEYERTLGPVFTANIPLRLKKMDEISREIVNRAKGDKSLVHWNYLTDIGEQDFNITAYTGEDDTMIYRIIDQKYKIDNHEFVYQFCIKAK